ncbi:hypothetical protein [Mucilaginibacter sp. NFX135]|uniref:hypothetical protein n=1 Tax=Mucilaginibacter sp. NFX135 TaxID=3402687 RepID=UPI003AFB113E
MYEKASTTPRLLYGIIAFLSLIGIAIVVRRMLTLIPVLINDYHPSSYGYCLLPV